MVERPIGLAIAGSDSGGGAGIQADIKAMEANGVYATTALAAVTAQNTREVSAVHALPPDFVEQQIDAVCGDLAVDVVKTGMLASAEIIEVVARRLRDAPTGPVVVDPVMISKTGFPLLAKSAMTRLKEELLPLASLVTPNVHEARALSGIEVDSVAAAKEAARAIHRMGPVAVLVKGGSLSGDERAIDTLYDGRDTRTFAAPAIDTPHTHGTGCTYASAIAAHLAHGRGLLDAIERAKAYVTEAIRHALPIGGGRGPTAHFYFLDTARR